VDIMLSYYFYCHLKAKDSDGLTVVIVRKHNIHNVEVEYLHGGTGLFCLDRICEEYDPLYVYTS